MESLISDRFTFNKAMWPSGVRTETMLKKPKDRGHRNGKKKLNRVKQSLKPKPVIKKEVSSKKQRRISSRVSPTNNSRRLCWDFKSRWNSCKNYYRRRREKLMEGNHHFIQCCLVARSIGHLIRKNPSIRYNVFNKIKVFANCFLIYVPFHFCL